MTTADAPIQDSRPQLMGHPVGLFLLFAVEMWERFSFYGMRAILVLYLKCATTGMAQPPEGMPPGFNPGRGWSKEEATNLQGWYGGMAYLLPIIGGLIADKMIGTHRSMLVGGALIALGHIALAISGMHGLEQSALGMNVFVGGLVLIIIGTGHFKPSVSVMVSQLYPDADPRRESAFGIFYMGINVGAFLGTTACAYLAERVGWHYGFGAAAVGMIAGLICYLIFRAKYLSGIGLPPVGKGSSAPLFVLNGVALAALVAVGFHLGLLKSIDDFISAPVVYWLLVVGAVSWSLWYIFKHGPGDRGPVASIFIFTLFNAFFWLAFEQAATSINIFTDEKVQREVSGFLVPTGWFQNINPIAIVIGAPLFGLMWTALSRRKKSISQPAKIGFGLIWLGLGYIFMVFAGMQAKDGAMASLWLVGTTYLFHTMGELFLSPTGLTYVSKAAPSGGKSLLMGVYFIANFVAYVVGGKLAGQLVEDIEKGVTKLPWNFGGQADFFMLFVVTSLGAGILILLLTPQIGRAHV